MEVLNITKQIGTDVIPGAISAISQQKDPNG